MNKNLIARLSLTAAISFLIINALVISRDYQDSWILEGLEIPYLLFVVTFSATFLTEKKISVLVVLAVVGNIVFLLIPNLKYIWFQGPWMDQHNQYALASNVVAKGNIASEQYGVAIPYIKAPSSHLIFSVFSIVLDIPLVSSYKYLPVFFSLAYPLLIYTVSTRLDFLNRKATRYVLFFSAIPINVEKYTVTGSMFGSVIAIFVLTSLVIIIRKPSRGYFSILSLFALTLATSHSVTSIILCGVLSIILLFQAIRFDMNIRISVLLVVTLICLTWLVFIASGAFDEIVRQLFVFPFQGQTPPSEKIPSRLYELMRVSIFGGMKTWAVFYGADFFLLFLSSISMIVLLRKLNSLRYVSKFLIAFTGTAFTLLFLGIPLSIGPPRVLHFFRLLFPIFVGFFIISIIRKKRWIRVLTLLIIVTLATVELYACQPLIPPANVLLSELPDNEPIVYVNLINTIYQRQMISFIERYSTNERARIACDHITGNQIVGLTDVNFSSARLIDYYPLGGNQEEQTYDYFLIHLPGIAGSFGEQAEFRTREVILGGIYHSNILYTNGESLILSTYIK